MGALVVPLSGNSNACFLSAQIFSIHRSRSVIGTIAVVLVIVTDVSIFWLHRMVLLILQILSVCFSFFNSFVFEVAFFVKQFPLNVEVRHSKVGVRDHVTL